MRTALQPRWIGLLLVALVLASAFAALGSWQLERSRTQAPERADEIHELTDVVQPQTALTGQALSHRVRVRGVYRPEQQLEVVERSLDGRPGRWVLTPLEVDGVAGTVPTLAVVRGWVPEGATLPEPPSGTVEVVGRLQGSALPTGPQADLAEGQVRSVSAADLVNVWGPPLYAGYLVQTESVDAGLEPVPVAVPGQDDSVNLLNVSYALQWWVFAGFAVFLWWRMVRDAHLRATEEDAEPAGQDGDGDTGSASQQDGRAEQGASR